MKFETPVLRLLTTADGPVCFDLTKESEQITKKDDLLNSAAATISKVANVPFCNCQCTCECTSPCNCQCTCECQIPCTCTCTCECESKGDIACAALTVENDPIVEIIDPIERTGEKIKLNSSFMFRQEKFGGLLFDKEHFVPYICNHTAWEIFQYIQKNNGLKLKELKALTDHLRRTFDSAPESLEIVTLAFLHGCLKKSTRKVRTQ